MQQGVAGGMAVVLIVRGTGSTNTNEKRLDMNLTIREKWLMSKAFDFGSYYPEGEETLDELLERSPEIGEELAEEAPDPPLEEEEYSHCLEGESLYDDDFWPDSLDVGYEWDDSQFP